MLRDSVWAKVGAIVILAVVTTLLVVLSLRDGPQQRPLRDAPSTSPTPIDTRPRALFIGDSWIGGSDMGGVGMKNWSFMLAEHFGWQWEADGIGGSGYLEKPTFASYQRADYIGRWHPDVLVVFNGINDLDPTKNADAIERLPKAADKAMSVFEEEIGSYDTHVVVVGYVPPGGTNETLSAANAVLGAAVRAHGFDFIDPSASDNLWFDGDFYRFIGEDRYHPTQAGHRYLAGVLIDRLTALGAEQWR